MSTDRLREQHALLGHLSDLANRTRHMAHGATSWGEAWMVTPMERWGDAPDERVDVRWTHSPDPVRREIDRRVFWQQPLPDALAELERMAPQEARCYILGGR